MSPQAVGSTAARGAADRGDPVHGRTRRRDGDDNMERTATAIVLATVLVAAGLSVAPLTAASHDNCHEDFLIPDSEPSSSRTLLAGTSEIGREDVSAPGNETLNVELTDRGISGELTWTVFEIEDSQCQTYTNGGCDQNNVLSSETKVSCTLEAPDSGEKSYWVLFDETTSANSIMYKTWAN